MKPVAERIEGYTYWTSAVPVSPVTIEEFNNLKVTVGWTDERFLRLVGEVLLDQTQDVVHHWRNEIIAGIPHLAKAFAFP